VPSKRGKTCTQCKAWETFNQRKAWEKKVASAEGGKTGSQCQARENMEQAVSGETYALVFI